jgi:hypothetical protein
VTAPTPGAGKGLTARLISRFAQEGEPAAKTLQGNDDEIKKELLSALLTSSPVLFFDEVSGGEIDSTALRTLATSEIMSGRLLGQSREIKASTRTLVIITGNNVTPSADSTRRILEIRLNPRCESPSKRVFDFDPIQIIDKNRLQLIRSALTIQSAYLHAGKPSFDVPAVGSFPDWHAWCRLPVLWLTQVDPALRILQSLDFDPKKAELAALLEEWHKEYGNTQETVANAMKRSSLLQIFRATVPCRPGTDPTALAIGKWFGKNKDRIAGGFQLVQGRLINGSQKWEVRKVEGKVG